MDERFWEPVKCEVGTYYYAEIEAKAEVLRITTKAQRNVTELGYWRDVATGLSSLVDKLYTEIEQLRKQLEVQGK